MWRISCRPRLLFAHLLAAIGTLAGATNVAFAETTGSFYLGSSRTSNSDLQVSQPGTGTDATFHGVNWSPESFTNPIYWGVRVSHFFERQPHWGAGFDYTHDKVIANTNQLTRVTGTWNGTPVNESAPINQRVQSFSITHGVNIFALNGYYRWMRQTSDSPLCLRCQPYVGAGLTYYLLHPESTVNGQTHDQGSTGAGFGYQLLGGLHYGITQAWGVFVEAKYNSGTVEVDIAGGGRAKTTLNSTQVLAGLNMAF